MAVSISREIEDIAKDLIRHQHDHPPVRDLNREIDDRTTYAGRVAEDFARIVGSWTFVFVQIVIMLIWMALNALGIINHWDAYPFQLLNLVLVFEVVAWGSLVLMALNRQTERERMRAQHDYELDVKAEEELKALMIHLMHQDEILLQIVNRLDRGDRELKRLLRRLEIPDESSRPA